MENVSQVGQRIDPVALATHDERIDDGRALAGTRMANEEPIFFVMESFPEQENLPIGELPKVPSARRGPKSQR